MISERRGVIDILGEATVQVLRANGWVVVHREPTKSMAKAFYAKKYPEEVVFVEGYHRVIATSIRQQKAGK